MAALTGISPELYEAAAIDGCSRWKAVWNITIPGIASTIVVLSILGLGNVLNAGFDQVFNLYSPLVYSTGDILDTWVYRMGLLNVQFSLATAAGLFKSVISFTLIVIFLHRCIQSRRLQDFLRRDKNHDSKQKSWK